MATVDVSDVSEGSVLRIDEKLWRVDARESRGTGKTSRVVHLSLLSIPPGSHLERNLKPGEKVEEVNVEKHPMTYLYRDGENFHFMDSQTYEQMAIPAESVGAAGEFMKEDMEIQVTVCEGQPVNVDFPKTVELRVASTLPAVHDSDTSAMKEATLENDMVVLVPQFIKEGDLVEVDVGSKKYLSRAKG
jgi:elongation factor P